MNDRAHRHNVPVNDGLHPLVYKSMLGLTAWPLLSIWVLFGSGTYAGLIFAMITLFFVVVTAIPLLLWQTWRRNVAAYDTSEPGTSFREWMAQEFATWTGAMSGREAATQILLPLAAVSIGMSVFGLVYVLDALSIGH